MKILSLSLFFCIAICSQGSGQDRPTPDELPTNAKGVMVEYERAVEQAARRAIERLETVKKIETQHGNLERALAVRRKIDELTAVATSLEPPPFARNITVKSTDSAGASLGAAKKGQKIYLQFASGSWASGQKLSRVSPDEPPPKVRAGWVFEQAMLIGLVNGKPEKIVVLPSGTRDHPFVISTSRDYEDVRVVMTDSLHRDNDGEVVYRAGIK